MKFPVGLDVKWFSAHHKLVGNAQLADWLIDTGSLTERLQSCTSEFSLTCLGQGNIALEHSELTFLGNAASQDTYDVREVVLNGGDQPWVYARSVLPQRLINAELANLGTQPLGKRLFNDARFVRSDFELCTIAPTSSLYQRIAANGQYTLWGRRSRFYIDDMVLIVAEVFLPDSPAYQQQESDTHEFATR